MGFRGLWASGVYGFQGLGFKGVGLQGLRFRVQSQSKSRLWVNQEAYWLAALISNRVVLRLDFGFKAVGA